MFEILAQAYNSLVVWFSKVLGPTWLTPPYSTLLVFLLAAFLAVSSSLITKALVDVEKMARHMKEITEWRKEYMQALKSGDQKLIAKMKKREASIKRMQSEMSKQQLKPLAATFVPFILIWWVFNGVFRGSIVAISPIPLPFVGYHLDFISWYIISSFGLTTLVQKLLGVSTLPE
ncbi:MAG: hypothetical protein DRJ33_03735 [Candidatus Methanomethylicota archaeon]|uniref:DUF106 domain-containing protein n=1 Tax=Thermoproteota archaeon TaxID=2056631 RepID=A0A497EZ37_9CREN|nr:MAG: hypothetical protein DRJ33_03735 [Candidatus Verstraetearchaeota archaeon]